jgi:hypothetical protein
MAPILTDTRDIFDDLRPVDLVALCIIFGGMILLFFGKDSTIATMLLAVTAFYFGMKTPTGRRLK